MSVWIVAILLLAEVMAIVAVMIAAALGYFGTTPESIRIVAGCVLFGGLGGCTYCLRGVYLNACVHKTWTIDWLPWYLIRPFVSAVLGGVSFLFVKAGLLLLDASQQSDGSQLGIWAVAFLAGLNVDKFIAKIEAVGQSVFGIEPSRQAKSLQGRESDG